MQRLTARFLLLFALAGTLAPMAMAITAAPPHACCLRKSAHQCHGLDSVADERSVRRNGCCNQQGCRAVITSRSAYPQGYSSATFAAVVSAGIVELRPATPATERLGNQSTRAPPQVSIS